MRAFISVDIEDPIILRKIMDVQERLDRTGADLKLVESSNLHFTLSFLGEIDTSQKDAICMRLQSLVAPPIQVRLRGVGAFPGPGKPRVIWLGVESGAENLRKYAEIARKITRDSGVGIEQEEFTPHLTIARVRSLFNKEKLTLELMNLSNLDIGDTLTSRIRLKRSTLTPKGPQYEILCESK